MAKVTVRLVALSGNSARMAITIGSAFVAEDLQGQYVPGAGIKPTTQYTHDRKRARIYTFCRAFIAAAEVAEIAERELTPVSQKWYDHIMSTGVTQKTDELSRRLKLAKAEASNLDETVSAMKKALHEAGREPLTGDEETAFRQAKLASVEVLIEAVKVAKANERKLDAELFAAFSWRDTHKEQYSELVAEMKQAGTK